MTYGYWLDRGAAALAAAAQATPTRARGHADAATTVAARNQVYAQLRRLHAHLAPGLVPGPRSAAITDPAVNISHELTTTTAARLLGLSLAAATVDPPAITPAPAAPQPAIADHLAAAADAFGLAADILASHLGPRRPRTPQGQAIAAGAGQRDALADLAQLAHTTAALDRRLIGWLSHSRKTSTLRPVYQHVLTQLRWWTRSRYPALLGQLATRRKAGAESILRPLEVAPATERATGPRPVASLHDTLQVLDTARAWLHQHPDQPSYRHILAATRLAVTITAFAERHHTPVPAGSIVWGEIARQLEEFTGLDGRKPDRLTEELDNASRWLRDQARQPGVEPQAQLRMLVRQLPGLAHQLDLAVTAAVRRARLCVADYRLGRSTSRSIRPADARWRRATLADSQVSAVRRALDRIAIGSASGRRRASRSAPSAGRNAYPNPPSQTRQLTAARPPSPLQGTAAGKQLPPASLGNPAQATTVHR